jgi:poly-gamma-glutamate system protein
LQIEEKHTKMRRIKVIEIKRPFDGLSPIEIETLNRIREQMSYYRKGKTSPFRLLMIAVCATIVLLGIERSKTTQRDPLLDDKVAAARLMKTALAAVKEERLRLGLGVDPENDPNGTGVIGKDYTDMTTTLGSLLSKRTSTNPNFAGIIVQLLAHAGVKPEDGVALSFSSSFPALNIAVLCAVRTLKLKPVIISSVGASMYGANDPLLTWLDMERVLREKGILPYASNASSLGGIAETKGGLDGMGIEFGLDAIRRNGIPYLDENGTETVRKDIERRLAIYDQAFGGKKPAAFVNTGGPLTSLGNSPEAYSLSNGLLQKVPFSKHPERGIIFRMAEKDIPVIHLLNIKGLAYRYGLPVDPIPLPPVPSGGIMRPQKYSFSLALVGLTFLCFTTAALKGRSPRIRKGLLGLPRP